MNKTNIIVKLYVKIVDKINEKPVLRLVPISAGLLLMIMIPQLGVSSFFVRVLTMIGLYTILGLSLNIITGYTGQVSIGQAGFCAIGAYTSALLNVNFGLNFFITSLCGALMAGLFGFLLGLPTLRLSGTYLTIATLGFGEIVRMIALNFDKLTNGPLGISGIQRPIILGYQLTALNGGFYYLVWALAILVTLFVNAIVRSKMGRALMAIRDDELVATLMGIKTTRYKVAAFSISAVIAGIGGSFYAHMIRYIDPNTFNFDISILIISIVILGGMGTIRGIFVGAALLISFPEILRFASAYRFVIYGLILVIMIRFRPQGLFGGQSRAKYVLPKGVKVGAKDGIA